MRVSLEWLEELVDINCSPEELADKLTMAGIAVEEIEDLAAPYHGMYVVAIKELIKHPNADKLSIAQVDAGSLGTLQVITNARNVKVGDLVPLATVGTVLSDGHRIELVELKGVPSQGMFCGGAELGLEKESAGVWVFTEDITPGSKVSEALGATDQVLVLELTANRSDCLGMMGVAREVAAILDTKLKVTPFELVETGPEITDLAKITIEAPDLCPRYAARVCLDVKLGPAPKWMQNRLKAAGIRPINNVVDITNYILMEYNQPLHSFNYDQINEGQIIVRRAQKGEKLQTLDNNERNLNETQLVIADPRQSLCVAGVMGGASSEVTEDTVNVLLEAAYFQPINIRRTAKALELHSESSLRFERGIDPNGTINALDRAAYLMQTLAGAKVAKGYLDNYPAKIEPAKVITSYLRINQLLGTEIPSTEICNYLEKLSLKVVETGEKIEVTVPSYRRDITHMADLAEEVARLYGYDRIPVTLPQSKKVGQRTLTQHLQVKLRALLQGNGISEIYTYSLYAKNTAQRLGLAADDPLSKTVELMTPLSEDQAVMRTTLVPGMLGTIAFNLKRRQTDLAFYEFARVFQIQENSQLPNEPLHLAVGLTGRFHENGWNQIKDNADFYDLKGLFELITDVLKINNYEIAPSKRPYLHPGQSAEVFFNGNSIGYFGQIHPRVMANFELSQPVFMMELDVDFLAQNWNRDITFKFLPKFPAVQRDLALVLPLEITPQAVIEQIKKLGGALLEQVELFDVYQGEQVPAGCRSLAFSLSYRAQDRTLNEQEVINVQAELLNKLNAQYGAVMRG